jgi:hypothetical protein
VTKRRNGIDDSTEAGKQKTGHQATTECEVESRR